MYRTDYEHYGKPTYCTVLRFGKYKLLQENAVVIESKHTFSLPGSHLSIEVSEQAVLLRKTVGEFLTLCSM